MTRVAFSLSVVAVAALAACAEPAYRPAMDPQAAPIAPQAMEYRPGTGTVERVMLSPGQMSSASGGTATGVAGSSANRLNRLVIRMDRGGTQYIDTDSNEFQRGTRVELTPDRMIRPLP